MFQADWFCGSVDWFGVVGWGVLLVNLGGDSGGFCVGCGEIGGKSDVSNSSCGFAAIRYVSYRVVALVDIWGGVFVGCIICSNSFSLNFSVRVLLMFLVYSWALSFRVWWWIRRMLLWLEFSTATKRGLFESGSVICRKY